MANRGPKPKLGDSESFQVTIPADHYRYLELLARFGRLGTRANTVAEYILIRELDQMFKSNYHEKQIPKSAGGGSV